MAERDDRRGRQALAAAAASALTAAVGGLGARKAPDVYDRLEKPRWAPPPRVFGPVWTMLYASMAGAVYRAWRADPDRGAPLLALHAAQLVLNAAWPWTFFSARSRRGALAVVVALDSAVAAEAVVARRRDGLAAGLLAPYLAWSLFATALSASVGSPATSSPGAASG